MKRTTNIRTIEKWIKQRHGVPAVVSGTDDLLRVKFDPLEDELTKITWAKFFKTFKEHELVFLYDEEEKSRFCKFITKDNNEN